MIIGFVTARENEMVTVPRSRMSVFRVQLFVQKVSIATPFASIIVPPMKSLARPPRAESFVVELLEFNLTSLPVTATVTCSPLGRVVRVLVFVALERLGDQALCLPSVAWYADAC